MVGSTQFTLSVSIGSRVAMDFNPVTDQARVVSRGSNYQVTFRATASRLFLSNSGSRGELSLVFPKLSLRLVSIRLRGGLILACTLLCAVSAKADWTVTRSEPHSGKDGLVTRVAVSVEDNKSGDTAQLQFAVFDTKKATMRVLDQPTEPRVSLAEMMQTEKCLAGVNGGYFDPEHAAVGLLITAGQTVQSKQRAKLLSGVVSDMGGRFQIERAAAFSSKKKPTEARQCGPFLVERGRAITGLNGTRSARRSFVMAAAKGRAAIGYSSSVTLAQLGDILATPDLVAELQVQSALNLDGGSSSGFWFAGSEGAFALREYKTVRDFIGIVAR